MTLIELACLITALAAAITGGTLFGFSTLVMPALNRLPAEQAILAMQSINLRAPRSLLMLPLVGSALGSVVIGGYAAIRPDTAARGWLLAGSVAGVLAFVITAAYHVPRNNALAVVTPHGLDDSQQWQAFAVGWHRWNHLRTVAALVAACLLVTGVLRG
ncbi:MAG: anthrone oxygenase family protein [Jatrophihabitantaceae bacterium]